MEKLPPKSDMKWRYNFHENRGVEKMARFFCCSVYIFLLYCTFEIVNL